MPNDCKQCETWGCILIENKINLLTVRWRFVKLEISLILNWKIIVKATTNQFCEDDQNEHESV